MEEREHVLAHLPGVGGNRGGEKEQLKQAPQLDIMTLEIMT